MVFNCRYHVVFCPKRRKKVLIGNIAIRFKEIIEKICDEINVILLAIEVMPGSFKLSERKRTISSCIETASGRAVPASFGLAQRQSCSHA
ncbi:MAG: transposase [Desulfobacterales bacterium]|nr:transposase [Desulfobacterales bacterium]